MPPVLLVVMTPNGLPLLLDGGNSIIWVVAERMDHSGPDRDREHDLHAGIGFSDSQLLGQYQKKCISFSDPGSADAVCVRRLF